RRSNSRRSERRRLSHRYRCDRWHRPPLENTVRVYTTTEMVTRLSERTQRNDVFHGATIHSGANGRASPVATEAAGERRRLFSLGERDEAKLSTRRRPSRRAVVASATKTGAGPSGKKTYSPRLRLLQPAAECWYDQ